MFGEYCPARRGLRSIQEGNDRNLPHVQSIQRRISPRWLRCDMCFDLDDNFPGKHHLADKAPIRILARSNTELFRIDKNDVERLIGSSKSADEDAAICCGYSKKLT